MFIWAEQIWWLDRTVGACVQCCGDTGPHETAYAPEIWHLVPPHQQRGNIAAPNQHPAILSSCSRLTRTTKRGHKESQWLPIIASLWHRLTVLQTKESKEKWKLSREFSWKKAQFLERDYSWHPLTRDKDSSMSAPCWWGSLKVKVTYMRVSAFAAVTRRSSQLPQTPDRERRRTSKEGLAPSVESKPTCAADI